MIKQTIKKHGCPFPQQLGRVLVLKAVTTMASNAMMKSQMLCIHIVGVLIVSLWVAALCTFAVAEPRKKISSEIMIP
jgi:hypothetical protein